MTFTPNNITADMTTAVLTELATPPGPPRVLSPVSQAMIAASRPNSSDLTSATSRSKVTANEEKVAM